MFGQSLLGTHFYLRAEEIIGSKWNSFLPFLVVEPPNQQAFVNSYLKIRDEDIIPIRNFNYKGIGNCLSLTLAQKKILEQVRFVPEIPALDKKKNEELFKKMIEGYFILVPGFSTVDQWVEFIGVEDVKVILGEWSLKLNVTDFFTSAFRHFQGIQLDSGNIKDLDISLSRGIPVPIRFRVDGQLQHQILIYQIKDLGHEYSIGFYDPNLGSFDADSADSKFAFTIDKKTGFIKNPLYSKKPLAAFIDRSQLDQSEMFKDQQKRTDIKKFLIHAESTGRFYFTLETLLK